VKKIIIVSLFFVSILVLFESIYSNRKTIIDKINYHQKFSGFGGGRFGGGGTGGTF
jgi:hypothetical protein